MRTQFTIPENLKDRLENISDQTGLSQSEIMRRGTLEEIKKLEGGQNART